VRAPRRNRWLLVVAGAGCAALAAVTFVVVGGREGRDAAPDGADPGLDPADVLSEDQLDLIRGAVPGPGCAAAPGPAPDDAALVALDVLRVEGTCLTAVTEYVAADEVDDRRGELERDPAVVAAGVSPPVYPGQVDDDRDEQWALDALGARKGSSELPWPDGTGAVVAVLDSGVDSSHPDLADAVIARRHYPREGARDPDGHGTHVAGIVAARRGNGGIVGVAPAAAILDVPVRLGPDINKGAGSWDTGLVWAVNNGATVANLSLGAALSEYGKPEHQGALEVATAAAVFALHNDVVVVASGGNCGAFDAAFIWGVCDERNEANVPALLPGVVGVGAVEQDDGDLPLASFSTRNRHIDLVAPGDDIVSTYPDRKHKKFDGTSQAAPHVAAAVAAARSVYPTATRDQVVQALLDTADRDRLAEDDRSDPGAGRGLLDIVGMLEALRTGPLAEPEAVADSTQAAFVRDGTLFAFDGTTTHPVRRVGSGHTVQSVQWSADHTQLVGADDATLFSWAGPGSEVVEIPCDHCASNEVAYLDDVAGTEAGEAGEAGDLVVTLDRYGILTRFYAHSLQQLGTATLAVPGGSRETLTTLHGDVNGLLLVHGTGATIDDPHALWLVDPFSGEVQATHEVVGLWQGGVAVTAAGDRVAYVSGGPLDGTCHDIHEAVVLDSDDLTQLADPDLPPNLIFDQLFFNGGVLYATLVRITVDADGACPWTGSAGLWRLDGDTWEQVDPNPLATARPLEGRTGDQPTGWLVVGEDDQGSIEPPASNDPAEGELGLVDLSSHAMGLWSTPTRSEVEQPGSGAGDAGPAEGAVPAEMAGTWSGTVEQTGAKTSTYTVVLDLTTLSPTAPGRSDYLELGCGGDLTLDAVEGDVVRVTETITYGSGCVFEVPIRLKLLGPNELLYTFEADGSQGYGVLTRS
jgi:subtilisin family serine protease